MKKLIYSLFIAAIVVAINPTAAKAETDPVKSSEVLSKEAEEAAAKTLINRLEVLHAIDKSDLTFDEKRAIRKEARNIKKELKELDGGIYISTGAIIIILLLIIIF